MAKRFALAAPAARVLLAGWLPDNLRAMLPSNVEFDPNAQEVRKSSTKICVYIVLT